MMNTCHYLSSSTVFQTLPVLTLPICAKSMTAAAAREKGVIPEADEETLPLIPCFLDGNATSTIPHKDSSRQRDAFECGCADGAGPNSRRGSHVYEINTWLWNFGRPQPRVGGLSVAITEKIRRKSWSEASKRGWATKKAST